MEPSVIYKISSILTTLFSFADFSAAREIATAIFPASPLTSGSPPLLTHS